MERAMRELAILDTGLQTGTAGERSWDSCLVLIGGRSGCGKTTLVDALVETYLNVYTRVPSFTSRARRPGEGDAEYRFVTREEMRRMHQDSELLSLDEAYGEYYGMSCRAIEAILGSGRFAVKEMHAKNHAAVRSAMPETISVLLQLADERWDDERGDLEPVRTQRLTGDRQYYASLDLNRFEIVHRIAVGETPNMIAEAVHTKLLMYCANRRQPSVV
jgi:guanylate kinase